MADFLEGFAYELGVSAPLTIEGNPVRGFRQTRTGASARLPSGKVITAKTVEQLVERYVKRTRILDRRVATTAEHLKHLRKGRKHWNQWRRLHPSVPPMLAGIDGSVHLKGCRLNRYDFSYANFCQAKLQGVFLRGANFHQAVLAGADFSDAHLEGANFCRTDLYQTNFTRASLKGANLQGVQLAKTILAEADLRDCKVYGMSAWDLDLATTKHSNLTITYQSMTGGTGKEEKVAVDGLDLAAFMYSTINNRNIARIIEGASRKWVLILGRFTEGREVLDAVASRLKREHLIPVIFDFQRPDQRDLIETLILLAGMSAFIIVDISNPRSTPLELQAIASNYGVPIFPIMKRGAEAFGMFSGLRKFRWVFPPLRYDTPRDLSARLARMVIAPAQREALRLSKWKQMAER